MSSRIQRISCETGLADDFPMLRVATASGDRWAGLRLQRMFCEEDGELEDSYVPRHILAIRDRAGRCNMRWVDGPSFEMADDARPDAVCIFPALRPYRASWAATSCTFLELDPELVDAAGQRTGSRRPVELRPGPADDDRFIAPIARALLDLAERAEAATELLAESLGLTLAAHLAQTYGSSRWSPLDARRGMAPSKIRKLEEFIDSRLDGGITLHELASFSKMSVFHFAHCFKETTGVAPYQYVLRRRIARAQQLLSRSHLAVSEVALRCGFSTQSHFTETFRRLTGAAPRQYRAASGVHRSPAQESDEIRRKKSKDV